MLRAGKHIQSLDDKVSAIREHFRQFIGSLITGYQTAEILSDGKWFDLPDLPIRLLFGAVRVISISWSKFDDLWLSPDATSPYSFEGSAIRWVDNAIGELQVIPGSVLQSVSLGRGNMSVDGKEIEIWTRLLLKLDRGWLEIFNALDENGYSYHTATPSGEFKFCL